MTVLAVQGAHSRVSSVSDTIDFLSELTVRGYSDLVGNDVRRQPVLDAVAGEFAGGCSGIVDLEICQKQNSV